METRTLLCIVAIKSFALGMMWHYILTVARRRRIKKLKWQPMEPSEKDLALKELEASLEDGIHKLGIPEELFE